MVSIIGATSVLGAALISNWDKIFPPEPGRQVQVAKAQNTPSISTPHSTESTKGNPSTTTSISGAPVHRADWAYRYFRPCVAGTYNVIVKSLEGDQYAGIAALRDLGSRFPAVAFRLVNTVAPDGASNQRFAIFAGNGLSRTEAIKLVDLVKKMGVAQDAYTVKQHWDYNDKSPIEWEIMR